jgi:hypothetical protein
MVAISLASEVIAKLGPLEVRNTMLMAWLVVLVLVACSFALHMRGWKLVPGRPAAHSADDPRPVGDGGECTVSGVGADAGRVQRLVRVDGGVGRWQRRRSLPGDYYQGIARLLWRQANRHHAAREGATMLPPFALPANC